MFSPTQAQQTQSRDELDAYSSESSSSDSDGEKEEDSDDVPPSVGPGGFAETPSPPAPESAMPSSNPEGALPRPEVAAAAASEDDRLRKPSLGLSCVEGSIGWKESDKVASSNSIQWDPSSKMQRAIYIHLTCMYGRYKIYEFDTPGEEKAVNDEAGTMKVSDLLQAQQRLAEQLANYTWGR